MKRARYLLYAAIPVAYFFTVIIGSFSPRRAYWTNELLVIDSAKYWQKSDGEYSARRVWPQPDEWIPFQSTYIVSRDGKDCARMTLFRPPWSRSNKIHHTDISKEGPTPAPLMVIKHPN